MTDNGKVADLDLSEFAETRITVKQGDVIYSLPIDLPTPVLVKMVRCLTVLGNAGESPVAAADDQVETADREMWEVMEAVFAQAQPQVQDVRTTFTPMAAVRLLGFLAGKLGALGTTSITSSPSPPSTREASPSATSSEVESSTSAPVE